MIKTVAQIRTLQKQYGLTQMQKLIESGQAWQFEGSVGRSAMQALEDGACFLPDKPVRDYYGNMVPARSMLEDDTKGTVGNSKRFWQRVEDGEIDLGETETNGWLPFATN